MTSIADSLIRSVHSVVETNIAGVDVSELQYEKAFQFVKYVVKKKTDRASFPNRDYTVEKVDSHYGYETIVLSGKKGFIKLTLEK